MKDFYLYDQALQRQAEFHAEARRDALVKEALKSNTSHSVRYMVGQSLVKLGERLVKQPRTSEV